MSKLALVSLLCLGTATATATAAHATETAPGATAQDTLFQRAGRPQRDYGWFVAPTSGFTSFDGRIGYTVGLRSAFLVNRGDHTWGFGLAGNVLGTNRSTINDNDVRDVGGYGGAYLQYAFRANSIVHAFADVTAGGGGWCARLYDDGCDQKREFGFIEPTLNLELNVFKWMRISSGVGYRAVIASDGEGAGPSNRGLSGLVARSSLVFGMF